MLASLYGASFGRSLGGRRPGLAGVERVPIQNGRCPELAEVEVSEAVQRCLGPAEVRIGELSSAGRGSDGDDLPQLR